MKLPNLTKNSGSVPFQGMNPEKSTTFFILNADTLYIKAEIRYFHTFSAI